jgi:hypothetical protein
MMAQGSDGRWTAIAGGEAGVRTSSASRERCLASLRRAVERSLLPASRREPITLVVETLPLLAGVAEAADVMGWDKRRVVTYIDRGRFPEPVQSLASGRIWRRADVEAFRNEWAARRGRVARATGSPRRGTARSR